MSTALTLQQEALSPVKVEQEKILQAFTGNTLKEHLQKIEFDAMNFVADTSTAKSRKLIASKARSISSKKTEIDAVGKILVADWKSKSKIVDASRKESRDFLDSLKALVRKPLTDWETRDTERLRLIKEAEELLVLHEEAISEDTLFDKEFEIAERERVLEANEAAARKVKEKEAEEARRSLEMERVAKEAEERATLESKAKIKEAEDARINAENEKREMAFKAEKEAEQKAIDAQVEKERAVAEERWKNEEVLKVRAEGERIKREADEKRANDVKRQSKVKNKAYQDLLWHGIPESEALAVVKAIAQGKISYLAFNY